MSDLDEMLAQRCTKVRDSYEFDLTGLPANELGMAVVYLYGQAAVVILPTTFDDVLHLECHTFSTGTRVDTHYVAVGS